LQPQEPRRDPASRGGAALDAARGRGSGWGRGNPLRRGRLPDHRVRQGRRQGDRYEAREHHRAGAAHARGAAARMSQLDLVDGWVEPELADEFPQLSLVHARVEVHPGPSPREVKQRLRMLADRYTGGKVVHMRQDPVPWAYRVFSRQVGIDPDNERTPVEAVALRRLKHGGLHSENLIDDALTIAIAETGVPLIAF